MQGKNVLRKEPMSREVNEGDVFSFNDAFQSKFYKVPFITAQSAAAVACMRNPSPWALAPSGTHSYGTVWTQKHFNAHAREAHNSSR